MVSGEILVRELNAPDVQRLEALVVMAAFSPERPLPRGAAESLHVRRWLDAWDTQSDLAIGAELDGRIIGAALARPVEPALLLDTFGIASREVLVAVELAHRCRGVGRSLLEALIERSREERVGTLVLAVSDRNNACSLYRRVGFEQIRQDSGRTIMARLANGPSGERPIPHLRLAGPSDSPAIAEFHTACWREAYKGLIPQSYLDRVSVEERAARWHGRLTTAARNIALAEAGGSVVGLVSWKHSDAAVAADVELTSLYVRADHRGTGLAATMLEFAIGTGAAHLWVFENNPRAQAFYDKHGFSADGERQIDPGTGVWEIRMVRS